MEKQTYAMPLIGDQAPAFEAETTQGKIRFPEDYKGKWVVLFSHPSDFTPVCTSEFVMFGALQRQFDALNIIGCNRNFLVRRKSHNSAFINMLGN